MSFARRACFLGNSHLGCLKLAADREPDLLPGRMATWFAGPSISTSALYLQESSLISDSKALRKRMRATSGGADRVDIAAYDLFVIVGAVFDYPAMLRVFCNHCLPEDVARGRQAGRAMLSESFFRALLAEMSEARPGERIARQIKAVNPAARVAILPSPYPAETLLDHRSHARALADLKGSEFFAELVELFLLGAGRAASAAGATLVPQGAQTLAAPGFTAARYNDGPSGLRYLSAGAEGADPDARYDPWHMNAEFGRMRLLDLAGALRAVPLAATA